jgi:Zn finger protein HypA/HybF involved in hydrogenase expression
MERKQKTTIKQITDYWIENNNINEEFLNFDWSEAHTHCWNCGDNKHRSSKKKSELERCHIIPHSLGGSDLPENYVLLCKECHKEAPNINNSDDMWNWIKSNHTSFSCYGTYRINQALLMFEQKEGYSFFESASNINNIDTVLTEEFKNITSHEFKINSTTYYYMLKNIIKKHTHE